MLSNKQIKYLKSLHTKKFRLENKQFIIEGHRIIKQALKSNVKFDGVWCTEEYANKNNELIFSLSKANTVYKKTTEKSLSQVCESKNNQGIIALLTLPDNNTFDVKSSSILILDNISDPGNMGTILRSAEWFGIKNIILSSDCVDPYNSKVVRSAMGAHFYLNQIHQSDDLQRQILKLKNEGLEIIGAELNGTSIKKYTPTKKWALILGSEAHGISSQIKPLLDTSITIPSSGNIESLNVAIAAGIILNHLT